MCGKYLVKFCCFVVAELTSRHLTKKVSISPSVHPCSVSAPAAAEPKAYLRHSTAASQAPGRRRRPEPASERGDPPNSPGRRTVGEVPVLGDSTPKRPFPIARPLFDRGPKAVGVGPPADHRASPMCACQWKVNGGLLVSYRSLSQLPPSSRWVLHRPPPCVPASPTELKFRNFGQLQRQQRLFP